MPTQSALSLQLRLRLARRAAQAAGDVIMANYGKTLSIQTKSSSMDLVTQVDLEADRLIQDILREECPDEPIITEESFQEGQAIDMSMGVWIVDPLDGTTNYAHNFPHFAVSIAYVEQGQPKVGVVYDPFKNELFTAIAGEEAMRNGVPIRTTTVTDLSGALLATGFPYDIQAEGTHHHSLSLLSKFLQSSHGIRRAGAAALDLAYVACGRLEGFWELHLSPWDVAAGMLLITCAGGQTSNFDGTPVDLSQRRINIVGSNGGLHPQILDITRP